jgi:gluconate/galactonate dehydratase
LKITDIRTAVVEANYDWTFTRVYTDEEITGLGESFLAPGLTGIIEDLKPLLVGEDPRNVDKLWSKMRWAASGAGSMGGVVYNAISGIEAALWDMVGKHYGAPIHRLLGGKYRDRVRIYADCHAGEALEALNSVMLARRPRWLPENAEEQTVIASEINHPVHGRAYGDASDDEVFTPEMYASRAREVVERGFTALKFDLDVPNPYTRDTHSGTLTHAEVRFMASIFSGGIGSSSHIRP